MRMLRGGQVMNECVILESHPPRRLSYSWHTALDEDMKKERPSRVTFYPPRVGGSSHLSDALARGYDASRTLPSISGGWPLVLSSLKSMIETGKPLAFDPLKTTT